MISRLRAAQNGQIARERAWRQRQHGYRTDDPTHQPRPFIIGAICLLLALASFEVIPINLAGFLLILLGAGLLASELFVTSYGVLGIGGVIAFVLGSLFLVDTSQTNLAVDRATIAGAAVAFSAIVLGIGYLVMRVRRRPAMTGREGLIGEIGEVREAIQPGSAGRLAQESARGYVAA